jgi:hypothetical protein
MANSHLSTAPFPQADAISKSVLSPHFVSHQAAASIATSETHPETSELLYHLPGDPSIDLAPNTLKVYLQQELATPVLDELYNHLWLVARRSGRSIDTLCRQQVKGRSIIATDEARLHLVWHGQKIYIKPVPLWLLNHDFWNLYLPPTNDTSTWSPTSSNVPRFAACGFLRSYAWLIRSRLDFSLAQESHLLPEEVTWSQWSIFIAYFRFIGDDQVSCRYQYGQLRLSRLNWAVRFFRPPSVQTAWFYEIPRWSIGSYIGCAWAPLFAIFASLSLVLSSMEIMLVVPADGLGLDSVRTMYVRQTFWVFSILVLAGMGIVWILLVTIPFGMLVWQLHWGFRHRERNVHKV